MTKKAKPQVKRTDDGLTIPFEVWRWPDARLEELKRQVPAFHAKASTVFTIAKWPHGHHRHVHVYGDES